MRHISLGSIWATVDESDLQAGADRLHRGRPIRAPVIDHQPYWQSASQKRLLQHPLDLQGGFRRAEGTVGDRREASSMKETR